MGALAGELATNRIGNGALRNLADPAGGIAWAKRADTLMEQLLREYPEAKQAKDRVDLIFHAATISDGGWEMVDPSIAIPAHERIRALADVPDFRKIRPTAPALRVADDYTFSGLLLQHRFQGPGLKR